MKFLQPTGTQLQFSRSLSDPSLDKALGKQLPIEPSMRRTTSQPFGKPNLQLNQSAPHDTVPGSHGPYQPTYVTALAFGEHDPRPNSCCL